MLSHLFRLCAISAICLWPFTAQSFQIALLKQLSLTSLNNNLVFSPVSVYQVLSLAANGANGHTQVELLNALRHNNVATLNQRNINYLTNHNAQSLLIANALFSKFQPVEHFIEVAKKYKATAAELISATQVNQWCASNTNNTITNVINDISDIELLLINAIYFKSNWKYKFNRELTSTQPFTNADKSIVHIQMMTQTHSFSYYGDNSLQLIELPYKDNTLSALIILPSDLNSFINSLTQSKLSGLISEMRKHKVKLQMPVFEFDNTLSLADALKELGIRAAFEANHADFSNISNHVNLHIDSVIEKVYLKVDEEGSEAAVVTALRGGMMCYIGEEDTVDMQVNRPFLFMIRDKHTDDNEDMLFIAKVDKLINSK